MYGYKVVGALFAIEKFVYNTGLFSKVYGFFYKTQSRQQSNKLSKVHNILPVVQHFDAKPLANIWKVIPKAARL